MKKIPAKYKEDQDPIGFNSAKVVHTFSANANSWTATEDCYVCGYLYYVASMGNNNAYVSIDAHVVAATFMKVGTTFYDTISAVCAPVRKNQRILINSSDYSSIKCYGK